MTDPAFDASLDFQVPGHASISERGDGDNDKGWSVVTLAEADVSKASLSVRVEEGQEDVIIAMGAHHVPNEDGTRAFHGNVDAFLSREQAVALHRFLGFLLGGGG